MDKSSVNTSVNLINNDGISTNTSTHVIAISQDKLLRILDKYTDKVIKNTKWITPFSIGLTILAALLTSDFKDFLSIPALGWKTLFIIGLAVCACFSIFFIFKKQSTPTVDELVDEIKGSK